MRASQIAIMIRENGPLIEQLVMRDDLEWRVKLRRRLRDVPTLPTMEV
jgi:hypothetical protein